MTVILANGRSLLFSPEWSCSDASVVFDSNSGDYWIVSKLAVMLTRSLLSGGAQTLNQIKESLNTVVDSSVASSDLMPTLQSLISNGLIRIVSPDSESFLTTE